MLHSPGSHFTVLPRQGLARLSIEVVPATIIFQESGALVEDPEPATVVQAGSPRLDDIECVVRTAVDRVEDLEPAPGRVIGEIEIRRARGFIPRLPKPLHIAVLGCREPRTRRLLGSLRLLRVCRHPSWHDSRPASSSSAHAFWRAIAALSAVAKPHHRA